jgi:hypothetical protein
MQSPVEDSSWPVPGSPRGRRKLTLAGGAIAPKVGFLALPRTHTPGHQLTVTTGGFLASRLVDVVPEATANR